MKKNFWFIIALIFMGYSAGLLTGPFVYKSKVYNTTIERIKQKRGGRDIMIDIKPAEPEKTKKELRKEKREKRKAERS